jgi:hypothetical protein
MEVWSVLNRCRVRHAPPATRDQMRQALTGKGVPAKITDVFLEMYSAFDKGMVTAELPKKAKTASTSLSAFAEQVYRPAFETMAKG